MKMTETPNSEFSDNYTNYTKLYLSITILLVNVLIQIYFIFLKWSLVRETIRFLMDPCGNPVLWGNVSVSGNAFICFSVACRCCGKDEVHRAVAMGTCAIPVNLYQGTFLFLPHRGLISKEWYSLNISTFTLRNGNTAASEMAIRWTGGRRWREVFISRAP